MQNNIQYIPTYGGKKVWVCYINKWNLIYSAYLFDPTDPESDPIPKQELQPKTIVYKHREVK